MLPASIEAVAVGQEYDGPLRASSPRLWLGVAPWGSVRPGIVGLYSRLGVPLPCLVFTPVAYLGFGNDNIHTVALELPHLFSTNLSPVM